MNKQIHKRINKEQKQRLRTQLAAYKFIHQRTHQYLEMTDSSKSFLKRKRLADFRSSFIVPFKCGQKSSSFLECFSSLHFNRRYFLSQIYVRFVLPEVPLSNFEVISAREKKKI